MTKKIIFKSPQEMRSEMVLFEQEKRVGHKNLVIPAGLKIKERRNERHLQVKRIK